jgi:hypothetical protein
MGIDADLFLRAANDESRVAEQLNVGFHHL